jgi:hypothetical protein
MFSNFTKCWVLSAKIDDYVCVCYANGSVFGKQVCVCVHTHTNCA